ncbi:class I SAM-dependent methyltransferase [Geminocystis sp. CENA526]|uniref:class I SAM-dependent methyltransferase n=1 Tax=Geminocystis sp. CENA526 TaxID=1355871 RepID=UPI003D6F15CB
MNQEFDYGWKNEKPNHSHNYYLPAILSMLPPPVASTGEKIKILDLGCGNGSLTSKIAEQGFSVTGIEESESGVKIASENFTNCSFFVGSIYDLKYQEQGLENAFDIVISSDVIEHLFFPRKLIEASKKCLKPNGQLLITTPYHGYWKNLALAISGKFDKHFTVLWDGGHIKFFSVKTLTQLLEESGFTDIKFDFVGRLPYLWKGMLSFATIKK